MRSNEIWVNSITVQILIKGMEDYTEALPIDDHRFSSVKSPSYCRAQFCKLEPHYIVLCDRYARYDEIWMNNITPILTEGMQDNTKALPVDHHRCLAQ
jgi:hypothetical protein